MCDLSKQIRLAGAQGQHPEGQDGCGKHSEPRLPPLIFTGLVFFLSVQGRRQEQLTKGQLLFLRQVEVTLEIKY